MSKPAAPSMPTERQVKQAYKIVTALDPKARIKSVGPHGVQFDYPDNATPSSEWDNQPFSGDSK